MEYSVWTAAYMAGALDAGRLIGVVEVFAGRNGVTHSARGRFFLVRLFVWLK